MTVEDPNAVDIIGYEEATGEVRMILVEHRDWSDTPLQLADLAAKLDAYIHYVDSGQLVIDEPDYEGCDISFNLYTLFPPPESIYPLFRRLIEELATAEIRFALYLGPDATGNVSFIELNQ